MFHVNILYAEVSTRAMQIQIYTDTYEFFSTEKRRKQFQSTPANTAVTF